MKNFLCNLLIFLFTFFPLCCDAWNPLGHMVVADIAYDRLTPAAKKKVDELISYFHKEYPDANAFVDIAPWADAIRSQKIETFTHWHYSDNSFSTDGTPIKNLKDSDNAVWALTNIESVMKNKEANNFERARFLAFLTHIVADLHQPLHTVSRISHAHPDGDRGGNDYFVYYKNKRANMHHIWDIGVSLFDTNPSQEKALQLEKEITARYPESYFGKEKINNTNYAAWADDGAELAKKYVYSAVEEEELDANYINNGSEISKQQIALAGYRLAAMLNKWL